MADQTVDSEMKRAQDEFTSAVNDMAAQIKAQTSAMAAPAPQPVHPPVDLRPEALTKMAQEQGVGAALQAVGQHILAPMQSEAYDLAIKTQRRVVERDPDLGRWAKKHKDQIDAAIKANPSQVANEGVDEIVRKMRDGDSEFQTERVESEVQRRLAEEKAKLAPAAPPLPVRPPVDRPGVAPVSVAPTSEGVTPEIAAVEVNPEAHAIFKELVPGGTEADFKAERYAMDQAVKELGPTGIRKAGGYPICSIEDIQNAGKHGWETGKPRPEARRH